MHSLKPIGLLGGLVLISTGALAESSTLDTQMASDDSASQIQPPEAMQNSQFVSCIQNLVLTGNETLTIKEIRQQCNKATLEQRPLTARYVKEVLTEKNPFVITPHRLNYALLGHYQPRVNKAPFEAETGNALHYENTEVQFQLSFKFPLAKNVHVFDETIDFYAAYTNRSFWQFFDDKDSIPFRETNHEPEVWAEIHTDLDFFDFNLHKLIVGLNHQSNGQSGSLSRGWNRLYVQGLLQHKNSYLSLKTWQRFDEADAFDNSFDYQKYLGDFEIEAATKWDQHSFGLTLRNRFNWNEYGSYQLDYTYPLTERLKGYVQLFNGYGDSLIDMDYHTQKFSIGIVLADRI